MFNQLFQTQQNGLYKVSALYITAEELDDPTHTTEPLPKLDYTSNVVLMSDWSDDKQRED